MIEKIKNIPSWARHLTTVVVLGLFVAVVSVFAAVWTGPGANPPLNNAETPLNVSSSAQTKTGNLTLSGGLNMASHIISGVLTPVAGTDAANKAYVDALLGNPPFVFKKVISTGSVFIDCGAGYQIIQCGGACGTGLLAQRDAVTDYTSGTGGGSSCTFSAYGSQTFTFFSCGSGVSIIALCGRISP